MITILSKIIKFTKINRYYYFKNNNFEEITLIIFFLNLFLISNKIKKYIFNDNIYVVNDNKIFKLDDNLKNTIKNKIIKKLVYKDKYFKIELPKIKNKIYIINDNISIDFLLKYFYNINRNNESFILIDYFKYNPKVLKIKFESCIKDIF
tara:strand:+ start:983 stop:1432 length:450 start_codon:yes stop_codon:yes gene_type:complete